MKRVRLAHVVGVTILLISGLYFFVYLARWEWNRAVVAGLLFVAAEVGIGVAVVMDRLRTLDDNMERWASRGGGAAPSPQVLSRIKESAPPPRDHFEWLTPKDGHVSVFVPVLMGMGVVASLLAWVVERIARSTAGPALERNLASRLAPLAWPEGGLTAVADRFEDRAPAHPLLDGPRAGPPNGCR